MKFLKILVIVFSTCFLTTLHAQTSSISPSIGIKAIAIAPITIENLGDIPLNFGSILQTSTSGTVTVTADGVRTYSDGVQILASSTYSAALFRVSGEKLATFSITLPPNNFVFLTNGKETMGVNTFVKSIVGTPQLSSGGIASFTVGATLSVKDNQAAGTYSGPFDVTVAYQ